MERLAKEKIAKQEKLKFLRHQMSNRFENMHSTTIQLPDGEGSNGIRERGMSSVHSDFEGIFILGCNSFSVVFFSLQIDSAIRVIK